LKYANKELASFTYTASHDLRSPIRSIVGFARMIREDSAHLLDEQSRDYLDRIIDSSDRMMQLIDDLLGYCETGKQNVHLRPVPLSQLLKQTLEQFEPRIKGIGADVSVASEMPSVSG